MGDFRDGLLKAGLVSPEQAKIAEEQKAAAEARAKGQQRGAPPPRPGNRGPGPGQGQGQQRQREPLRDDGPRDRTPANLTKEEQQRLIKVAQAGKVEGKTRGQRRYYYEARSGAVPFIEISDEVARDLDQGIIAIAESERGDTWIVTSDCARELQSADPAWIRCP